MVIKATLEIVLYDINHQIGNIQLWTKDKSFDDYISNDIVRLAIERAIEIISEASRRIPDSEKNKFSDIPWRRIADVGNVLRHEYHDANDKIIWDITQNNYLHDLKKAIDQMNPDLPLPKKLRQKRKKNHDR